MLRSPSSSSQSRPPGAPPSSSFRDGWAAAAAAAAACLRWPVGRGDTHNNNTLPSPPSPSRSPAAFRSLSPSPFPSRTPSPPRVPLSRLLTRRPATITRPPPRYERLPGKERRRRQSYLMGSFFPGAMRPVGISSARPRALTHGSEARACASHAAHATPRGLPAEYKFPVVPANSSGRRSGLKFVVSEHPGPSPRKRLNLVYRALRYRQCNYCSVCRRRRLLLRRRRAGRVPCDGAKFTNTL